jgi:hypothetical protein
MQNNIEQPLADTPRNHVQALLSIILSLSGFVLPCLSMVIINFPLHDFIRSKMGPDEFDYLTLYIPMTLWIAGPLSIIVGVLYLRKQRNKVVPGSWNNIAKIGIGLGILTIPLVLCPLLFLLGILNACITHNGC